MEEAHKEQFENVDDPLAISWWNIFGNYKDLVDPKTDEHAGHFRLYCHAKAKIFSSIFSFPEFEDAGLTIKKNLKRKITAAFQAQYSFNKDTKAKRGGLGEFEFPRDFYLTDFHRAMWAMVTNRPKLAFVWLKRSERYGDQMSMALALLMKQIFKDLARSNNTYGDELLRNRDLVVGIIEEKVGLVSQEVSHSRYLLDFIFDGDDEEEYDGVQVSEHTRCVNKGEGGVNKGR